MLGVYEKLKSMRFGFIVIGLLTMGFAGGLAFNVFEDFTHPARTETDLLLKRQAALWGHLQLQRAVQALKDCILRGDSQSCGEYPVHMQDVDRLVLIYENSGPLDAEEKKALSDLHDAVPKYKAAFEKIRQMRAENATISEIDNAVKGADRPAASAFRALEERATDIRTRDQSMLWEAVSVVLLAALGMAFLYFSV